MRQRLLIVVGILSVLPLASFAEEPATPLSQELTSLERFLEEHRGIRRYHEELFLRETSPELFPAEGGVSAFVTVMADGVEVPLTDVPKTSWFGSFVADVASRSIISGYRDGAGRLRGLFGPADNITAEQMAKIVTNAAGIDPATCTGSPRNPFAQESWAAQFICCGEDRGWALFTEDVPVRRLASRGEVISTVLQALNIQPVSARGDVFTDVKVSTSFAGYIEAAANDGIVSGATDALGRKAFRPEDPVTRAEAAKIVSLSLKAYGK